ncbi:MAG TPA: hypothetical protein VFH80_14695 [Solirubrobacteraceae bacterium]|nr:hypothetical protein [Solirubrobacteraceae bacterium]
MLHRLRKRLTYANVMSTLAVFIALGGSSYAAFTINGASIKNRSIAGKKLRHNTLTGVQIKESQLARVPRAKRADSLGGLTAADLKIKCPSDTFPAADVCVERTARPAAAYGSAVSTCMLVGTPTGPGRRLPTHGELLAAFSTVDPAPGGELTSDVYPSSSSPGRLDVLFVTDKTGAVGLTPDTAAGSKAYRCVTDPLN